MENDRDETTVGCPVDEDEQYSSQFEESSDYNNGGCYQQNTNIGKKFSINSVNTSNVQEELTKSINDLAKEKDISLKIFNILVQKEGKTIVEKRAFEVATRRLLKIMKKFDLPRYVKSKRHLQQMIDGKFYISKGQKGFEKFLEQNNVKHGGIIYYIKCKKDFIYFQLLIELIYIGRTWKSKLERFIEHVFDAINSYVENYEMPSRLLECAILLIIEEYLNKKYRYDLEISSLDDFIKYKILGKEKWRVRREIIKIAKKIYDKYFYVEILEIHRNYETTKEREVWWIKNYPRIINGKYVEGTLNPNGLNMVDFPTRLGHISLPMYDLVFVLSLGYIGPQMNEMLEKYYDININYRAIYTRFKKFWKSWDNSLRLFFKPILQKLLEYDYDWQDIARALHRSPSYRTKKNFKKWFFGLNVSELRMAMNRDDFKWRNLKKIAQELNEDNKIKGVSKDIWIEWFVKDIGMDKISKRLGYKNKESFQSSWKKQGRYSVFQKEFAYTYTDAVIKYRRIRAIELLTSEDFVETLLDSRLYWIYVNKFGFKSWKELAQPKPSQGLRNCRKSFNKLFIEEGLTFEDLENLTYSNFKTPKYSDLSELLDS